MKILQIDSTYNAAPTGRYAAGIGEFLITNGHISYMAYGRSAKAATSIPIKIGSKTSILCHVIQTRLLDRHGFASRKATRDFIKRIGDINPDLIHLHNIHGYFININLLFEYLAAAAKPVVWTLHDCWSFTGHCSYFDNYACEKWKTECFACPAKKSYPSSWVVDNSRSNYNRKKALFTSLDQLIIVTPSLWLAGQVGKSFLNKYPIKVINVGIDLDRFFPVGGDDIRGKYNIKGKHIVLGVASVWSKRKGLDDFIKLHSLLSNDTEIVLVGLSTRQISELPKGICGISRTDNLNDLVALYSIADVFINPTYMDNFPATNLEALACGTPVITYNTGGSPESISETTGFIIKKGDILALRDAISFIISKGKGYYTSECRLRAVNLYDRNTRSMDYLDLYNSFLVKKNSAS